MKKSIYIFVMLFLIFDLALAQGISSDALIKNAKIYDGKAVIYRGEVIGDVMKRGDFAWVNIHDGENAIGIWAPLVFTKEIVHTGSYRAKGDVIEVSGIFNRACSEHGGDLDLHAQTLRKIGSGKIVRERINPSKVIQASIILGVLFLVWISTLFLRK